MNDKRNFALFFLVNKSLLALSIIILVVFNFVSNTSAASFTVEYQYDKAGRLVNATYGTSSFIWYTYDAAGNLTKLGPKGKFPWTMFLPAIINNATGYNHRIPFRQEK